MVGVVRIAKFSQCGKKLNHSPFTTQFFAIQLIHGVISIPVVIKLLSTENKVNSFNKWAKNLTDDAVVLFDRTHHKAKSILQVDFTDAPVTLKELLHISLSGV